MLSKLSNENKGLVSGVQESKQLRYNSSTFVKKCKYPRQ